MPFLSFLTEAQARAIHADRRPYRIIGKEYGVSAATVGQIKIGKTWKHLKLENTKRYKSLEQHERQQRRSNPPEAAV
jgi:hypothetical protein